jgi:hypothetical protein
VRTQGLRSHGSLRVLFEAAGDPLDPADLAVIGLEAVELPESQEGVQGDGPRKERVDPARDPREQ